MHLLVNSCKKLSVRGRESFKIKDLWFLSCDAFG